MIYFDMHSMFNLSFECYFFSLFLSSLWKMVGFQMDVNVHGQIIANGSFIFGMILSIFHKLIQIQMARDTSYLVNLNHSAFLKNDIEGITEPNMRCNSVQ